MQKETKAGCTDIGGVIFSHPIGLGSGLVRDCEKIEKYSAKGFSFVMTGPVTPVAQIKDDGKKSLINRIFSSGKHAPTDSKGVRYSIDKLKVSNHKSRTISIISYMDSSIYDDLVSKDLCTSLSLMYDFTDAFAIDITQTRGDGTAPLLDAEFLENIFDELLNIRLCYDSYKPIFIKLGKNCLESQLNRVLDYAMYSGIDGIIPDCSGADFTRLEQICEFSKGRFPVIADGIANESEALLALQKGANLVSLSPTSFKAAKKIIKAITLK